jgi:chemotaxis protein methyltransferase CheR
MRNVLIYFQEGPKRDILEKIGDRLDPNGYLVLGAAENPSHLTDRFKSTRIGNAFTYQLEQRKKAARNARTNDAPRSQVA